MDLVGAIDQGTSSSRFLVFEIPSGKLVASHQIEITQKFPKPGWVEIDAEEILDSVVKCIEATCERLLEVQHVKAVGISNQRETTVLWDRETGKPLHNAIVWLDCRTAQLAEEFTMKTPNKSHEYFKASTGLPIHPYFSVLKLRWLLDNDDSVKEALRKGTLMFGNVDTWLMWKLTGKHVTDVTNASRTLLLDLKERQWSKKICEFFDIPMNILPEIRSSAEVYGQISCGALQGIPISGCLGDQQAALVGHQCLKPGDCKNTYGTGTFMLCNIGTEPVVSIHGLLTTVAFQFGSSSQVFYALEGSGSIGGTAIRFLRDNFSFFKTADESEELAASVKDCNGVVFVPCFSGLYTPYWDPNARAIICGLSQSASKAHVTRAALEAVCYQSAEMISAIEKDLPKGESIKSVKIDGGMTKNKLFDQMQSDILGMSIACTELAETTGWGAAIAAAIGANLIRVDDYMTWKTCKTTVYSPRTTPEERKKGMDKWADAIRHARKWQSG